MPTRSRLALGLTLLVGAVISVLTLTPISAPELHSFQHTDKIYHALAFAGLALPVALFRPGWLTVAVPVYTVFGGLIEIVQPFVGRECSLADWIADLIGIALGIIVGLAATSIALLGKTVRGHYASGSGLADFRGSVRERRERG